MKHVDVENILNGVFDLERVEPSKGLGKMIRDVEDWILNILRIIP